MQVWANRTQEPKAVELVHKNLTFNLNTYYKTDGEIGFIEYSKKRKLATAGLAAYRQAIIKGIRHVMQLEFADDIDMFYIFNKQAAAGGLRSRVYNNEIRMDNIQHNLLALIKILDRFDEKDFEMLAD